MHFKYISTSMSNIALCNSTQIQSVSHFQRNTFDSSYQFLKPDCFNCRYPTLYYRTVTRMLIKIDWIWIESFLCFQILVRHIWIFNLPEILYDWMYCYIYLTFNIDGKYIARTLYSFNLMKVVVSLISV